MAGDNHAGDSFDGFPVDVVNAAEAIEETFTGFPQGWEGSSAPPKLAIVGSHPATRQLAPYENENFDIWLFNESPMKPEVYRRWSASFQMHRPEVYRSLENWVNKDHWPWLQQDHGERVIWMQDVDPDVPNSRRYPLEGVLAMVGGWLYLRSTVAMAIALGVYLGYKHIELYGAELTSNTEYGYQAINAAFWIGFAKGYGVNLELHCWQAEFDQPIYGYDGEIQIPRDFFELRVQDWETQGRVAQNNYRKVQDRLSDALLNNQHDKARDLIVNLQELAINAGEAAGGLAEAKRYLARENEISRQEFERVSAQAQMDAEKAKEMMFHHRGEASYVYNVWKISGKNVALGQLRDFLAKMTEQAFEAGRLVGVYRENLQYQAQYDTLVTAAGGQRAVSQAERLIRRKE